jgi:hypothetical protein
VWRNNALLLGAGVQIELQRGRMGHNLYALDAQRGCLRLQMPKKRRAHSATLGRIGYEKEVKLSSGVIGNETIKTRDMSVHFRHIDVIVQDLPAS